MFKLDPSNLTQIALSLEDLYNFLWVVKSIKWVWSIFQNLLLYSPRVFAFMNLIFLTDDALVKAPGILKSIIQMC